MIMVNLIVVIKGIININIDVKLITFLVATFLNNY